jgi:hypothetical protein
VESGFRFPGLIPFTQSAMLVNWFESRGGNTARSQLRPSALRKGLLWGPFSLPQAMGRAAGAGAGFPDGSVLGFAAAGLLKRVTS